MSDGPAPDLRPARPVRRRASSNGEAAAAPPAVVPPAIEALVRDGLAAVAHRQEELAELLEAAIDHLLAIERRLDTLEASTTAPAPKPAPAKRAAKAGKKAAPPKAPDPPTAEAAPKTRRRPPKAAG